MYFFRHDKSRGVGSKVVFILHLLALKDTCSTRAGTFTFVDSFRDFQDIRTVLKVELRMGPETRSPQIIIFDTAKLMSKYVMAQTC